MNEFLNYQQVADLLQVNPKTVRKWKAKNLIPYCQTSGHRFVRFYKPTIVAWMNNTNINAIHDAPPNAQPNATTSKATTEATQDAQPNAQEKSLSSSETLDVATLRWQRQHDRKQQQQRLARLGLQ